LGDPATQAGKAAPCHENARAHGFEPIDVNMFLLCSIDSGEQAGSQAVDSEIREAAETLRKAAA
jgi:hypothetical protein